MTLWYGHRRAWASWSLILKHAWGVPTSAYIGMQPALRDASVAEGFEVWRAPYDVRTGESTSQKCLAEVTNPGSLLASAVHPQELD